MNRPVVFTPANEPYLGSPPLKAFDDLIVASLKANSHIAPHTHTIKKTSIQLAACQLIPQSISLALSTRELIRQGYLFGALVMVRPLLERAIILIYLEEHPGALPIWERGWEHKEAPSLAAMLNTLGGTEFKGVGPEITGPLNALTHGKPENAKWTLVGRGDGQVGYGVSKILDNPALCDKICVEAMTALSLVTAMMCTLFPEAGAA